MLTQILNHFNLSILPQFVSGYTVVIFLMILGFGMHFVPDHTTEQLTEQVVRMPLYAKTLCIVAMILLVIQTKSAEVQPFIYFQF
jgi:alginate O-acetyltransferase complex protein AlgI